MLAKEEVSIHDVILNHRCAFYLQGKRSAAARKIPEGERLALFDGFERTPRGDTPDQRQFLHFALDHLVLHGFRQLQNFDGAALVVTAANKTFLLERGDVLVDGGPRGQLQALADFLEASRVA